MFIINLFRKQKRIKRIFRGDLLKIEKKEFAGRMLALSPSMAVVLMKKNGVRVIFLRKKLLTEQKRNRFPTGDGYVMCAAIFFES